MVPIRLTNLLGSIVGTTEIAYDPARKSIAQPLDKETFYRWEAQLAQCAYLSRLVYTPSEVFLRGIQFLEYSPDVMNDIITQLEQSFYGRASFDALFLSQDVPEEATEKHGRFFPRTGCALFHHHNPASKINNQKTLYVVFKGSSSFRDFKNDLNIIKTSFAEIPQLADLPGTTHGGFYKHMREEVAGILSSAIELSAGVERVVITGHSLGGAMATLFSIMMARQKKAGAGIPALHCVTFGAPNLLSDDARNSYNRYLLDGVLTLDRVTGESKGVVGSLLKVFAGPAAIDVIILIPGAFFSHPGFNILKSELYATSKTGRAKDIDDIRAVFLGSDQVIRRKGAGSHELPADPVFWNLFAQWGSDATIPLETRLKNYGQMKRYKNPEFMKFVLQDLQPTSTDMEPAMTPEEEKAVAKEVEQQMTVETADIAAAAQVAEAEPDLSQSGGAFATSSGASEYKKQTLVQFPNRVNYQCYKHLSAGFCHAAYMGIGFLSAVRVPVIRYRDETGKLRTKFVRKLEPTKVTDFVSLVGQMNPQGRYYAVPAVSMEGGKREARKRTAMRLTRRKPTAGSRSTRRNNRK